MNQLTISFESPEEWASTVASFYNWRVLKQSGVEYLPDLIGRIRGYEWVPALFLSLQMSRVGFSRYIGHDEFAFEVLHPNPEFRGYLGILSGDAYGALCFNMKAVKYDLTSFQSA